MSAHNFIDLSGAQFGRLTVISQAPRRIAKVPLWHCRCSCGNACVVEGKNLRGGLTTSCGCLRVEATGNRRRSHGMTESVEYKTWCGIKRRCFNSNERCFHNYGGRGIRMAPEWAASFEQFLADMGPRPSDNHTIERLNCDGHYEKGNCVWLEAHLQAKNRRGNVVLTYRGETKILSDWAAAIGLPIAALQARIYRGWSVERTLTEPLDISRRNKLAKKVPAGISVAVKT